MKIILARPVLDKVEAESESSLIQLIAGTSGHSLHYIPCIGTTIVHDARNYLVRSAYEYGFDAILFMDADMEFPGNTLMKLLSHDKPITGVMYSSRVKENWLNVFDYNADKNIYVRSPIQPDSGLQKVDGIGFGITLVKKEVFDAIRDPWFFYDMDFSEDINFCRRAQKCGYKIYCDTELDIAHIGKRKYKIQRSKKDGEKQQEQ